MRMELIVVRKPRGVLVQREATLLLKLVAQGEADVRAGRVVPQSEVFARAKERLRRRMKQR